MVTKAQKFRLGIFIVVGSVLIIVFFILIAGKKIMEKRDVYYIKYKDRSVTGLQVGGPVKYHGIGIGRIDDISIDKEDVASVIVTLSIEDDTPIKSDVKATLVPVGITGLLQIELVGGTNEAKTLKPGAYIDPGTSTFENITGKAEVIAEKLEVLLNNFARITDETNQQKIANILHNVDSIVANNTGTVDTIMTNISHTSADLQDITASLKESMQELNTMVQSGKFQNVMDNLDKTTTEISSVDMSELLANTNNAVIELKDTVEEIGSTHLRSRQDLIDTIETLEETVEFLNEFARRISEDPSLIWRSKTQ